MNQTAAAKIVEDPENWLQDGETSEIFLIDLLKCNDWIFIATVDVQVVKFWVGGLARLGHMTLSLTHLVKEWSAIVAHLQVKIVIFSGKGRLVLVNETHSNTALVDEVDLIIAKCVRIIALFFLLKVYQSGSVCLVFFGIDVFTVCQVAFVWRWLLIAELQVEWWVLLVLLLCYHRSCRPLDACHRRLFAINYLVWVKAVINLSCLVARVFILCKMLSWARCCSTT